MRGLHESLLQRLGGFRHDILVAPEDSGLSVYYAQLHVRGIDCGARKLDPQLDSLRGSHVSDVRGCYFGEIDACLDSAFSHHEHLVLGGGAEKGFHPRNVRPEALRLYRALVPVDVVKVVTHGMELAELLDLLQDRRDLRSLVFIARIPEGRGQDSKSPEAAGA